MSILPVECASLRHPVECTSLRHPESQHKHVVVAIWVIAFLQAAVVKSMGVLLPVLLDQFAAHTRNVGVVVSLTFFCGNLIGKCLSTRVVEMLSKVVQPCGRSRKSANFGTDPLSLTYMYLATKIKGGAFY